VPRRSRWNIWQLCERFIKRRARRAVRKWRIWVIHWYWSFIKRIWKGSYSPRRKCQRKIEFKNCQKKYW